MIVESPADTEDRYRDILGLLTKGVEACATRRAALDGAEYRRRRHPQVYAGEVRADLVDWLNAELPPEWSLRDVPNSGVEMSGPVPATIIVRRPDSAGHAPNAETARRRWQYRRPPGQFSLFDHEEPDRPLEGEPAPVSTLVVTWDYDDVTSAASLTISAPSDSDEWYWRDEEVGGGIETESVLEPPAEADDDPLGSLDESDETERKSDGSAE